MARMKRKRETGSGDAEARDARIADPYALAAKPCRLSDHRKKSKAGWTVVRNCAENPNCLYGLGEHQKGIWQEKKLIQRVFGDDPRDRRRKTVANGGSKRQKAGDEANNGDSELLPCGLRNLGATCYLNSMLQCLFVNLPFRRAVYEWEPKEQNVNEEQVLQMRALQKLFAQMQLGNQSMYDPTEFASTLSLNNVVQQDAQEFNKLLLAHLRTIFGQSRVANHWNLVDRVFQGHMSYVTKCLRCKTRSLRPSSYYELSLNIKSHKTLEDSIASYLSAEVLEGDNKYFCEHCNSKERAERYLELDPKKLPDTITFQLIRFVYDANAGRKKKLMDVIEINETLNMTDILRQSGHAEAFKETQDTVYRLSGYLNHRGKSAHVGHYTASVAYPNLDRSAATSWYEFDDTVVSPVTPPSGPSNSNEVQGKKIRSRDIYMLLYVRDEALSSRTRVHHPVETSKSLHPSPSCLEDIETLNAVFDIEVKEYATKVRGMEKRIAERVDVYKKFFEKEHPYPDPTASKFYWVDVEWLRQWITGEEEVGALSPQKSADSSLDDKATESGEQVDATTLEEETSSMRLEMDTEEECKSDVDGTPDAIVVDDDSSNDKTETTDSLPILDEQDIPFAKPMSVSHLRCRHSFPENPTSDGEITRQQRRRTRDLGHALTFSPETMPKLKRISEKFYLYLKANSSKTSDEPASSFEFDDENAPIAFDSSTYRCSWCEKEFCSKLCDDADKLKEVELETGLLKTVAGQINNGYLMSRAWIASYKMHLQVLHKVLSASAKKKGRGSMVQQDMQQYFGSGDVAINKESTMDDDNVAWHAPLNIDITCPHGNLSLEKKKYRVVPPETWSYFASKFAPSQIFPVASATPCPECQMDEAAEEEATQAKRACRDQILERSPLGRLYRKKAPSSASGDDSGAFLLSEVFSLSGTHGTKSSGAMNAKRRMFIVPREWVAEWRAYIRDVQHDKPSPLTLASLTCEHGRLILPQSLRSALNGDPVDRNTLDVEFIDQDEMTHLVDLYGSAGGFYYYAILEAGTDNRVLWRRCSHASLIFAGQEAIFEGDCPDDVIPLECEDDNPVDVRCTECEQVALQVHQCELENFENRAVNIQLVLSDQPVPTTESLTPEANLSGRRRSKRIRPGSASTWRVFANATDTVYMLKTKIYNEIDALPIRQQLYFRGEVIEDRCTLKACGIKAGDAVFMRLSEDSADDLVIDDETLEREIGFEDSVFLTRRSSASTNGANGSGRHRGRGSRGSNVGTLVWVCSSCTYVNDEAMEACEMCSTAKAIEVE